MSTCNDESRGSAIENLKERYPDKFKPLSKVFGAINPGDRIFISTACAEPQFLVNELTNYVKAHPKAFFDAEVLHVWTLGVAPYTDAKFQTNFRHNSFFIGDNTRDAVNQGMADYTPIFLSQVPALFRRGLVPVDIALIQVSPPDKHCHMSLGISVDIVKQAVESARLVVAQINQNMPRIHGDGFIHISDIDYLVHQDEPLLNFSAEADDDVCDKIGQYVAKLVEDGDTIQVGYGSVPNAVVKNLKDKKHLGVHSELLGDGLVELMRQGVIDNTRKTINRGKSVATFCMGCPETYEFVNDNPAIEFRTIDYTNNPLIIAQQECMTAINSALEIDLTGQATAVNIGSTFYSGIGGQADFMRGAVLAKRGKSILAIPSTALNGEVSRIVPFLREGAGATLIRGDVHYVVTEYGIAYLHGKNIREQAMDLISIAHPKFRTNLILEAKKRNLIYKDQAFIPGKRGEYPENLETYRSARNGMKLLLRPVKISDEPLIKDFFYHLSDQSTYRRFISARKDMPHERRQDFVVIDYTREMVILAINESGAKDEVVGIGQYGIEEDKHTAEVSFVVRDDYQNQGVGSMLLDYITVLGKRKGLLGFTAEVLVENKPMMRLFERGCFDLEKRSDSGVFHLKMAFRGK